MRTSTEILELFLEDEVIEFIVAYSNFSLEVRVYSLASFEFKCFLGNIFTSQFLEGVSSVNKEKMGIMY